MNSRTPHRTISSCTFRTKRLIVGEWHAMCDLYELELDQLVARLLTKRTTAQLPPEWSGSFSMARARQWIEARDAESPTLLAIEHEHSQPVALLILFESPYPDAGESVEVRLGYVLGEWASGQGMATELVGGFVDWAIAQPTVGVLTGGVANGHAPSMRVLLKNGFVLTGQESPPGGHEQIYKRSLRNHSLG